MAGPLGIPALRPCPVSGKNGNSARMAQGDTPVCRGDEQASQQVDMRRNRERQRPEHSSSALLTGQQRGTVSLSEARGVRDGPAGSGARGGLCHR